jgi:hypothetical protein
MHLMFAKWMHMLTLFDYVLEKNIIMIQTITIIFENVHSAWIFFFYKYIYFSKFDTFTFSKTSLHSVYDKDIYFHCKFQYQDLFRLDILERNIIM